MHLFFSSILCLIDGPRQSSLSLVCELVFLVDGSSLFDSPLDELSYNSKSSISSSNQVIFLIDFLDLGRGVFERILYLLDGVGVDIVSLLDLVEGIGKGSLGVIEKLVLGIESSEVVVTLDGSLGDGLDDFSDFLIGLGGVVGNSGSDGSEDRSSNGESYSSSDKTGGEFDGLLLDGDESSAS